MGLPMKLISLNVSMPQEVHYKNASVTTGIFKHPITGRVMLRTLNLDGDGQADLSVHGGIYKAVYGYPAEHYPKWQQELKRDDLAYGQFGENFTVEGLLEDDLHIGDVYRIGGALLRVTAPRMPCYKLDIKMGMPGFGKLFLKSERSGFYFSVLEEGEVGAGDSITQVESDPHKVSIRQFNRLYYAERDNVEMIEQLLRVESLEPGWRTWFEELLNG